MKQTYQSETLQIGGAKLLKANKPLVMLALCAISLICLGTVGLHAQPWDVINETYGSGAGEVSFNANYSYVFGSVAPTETLSAGKATLSVPQGTPGGVLYPVKPPTVPDWGGDANVTIEWKMAFRQGASAIVFCSQSQSRGSSTWGTFEMFDRVYGPTGYQTNAIADYAARINDQNLAPPDFDSSVPHTYRFVRQGGTNKLYLDNDPIPLISPLVNSPGAAAADGYRWMWGFYKNADSASEVDIYYFKAAHGAFPPGVTNDSTPPTIVQVFGSPNRDQVSVVFSEPVTAASGTNPANYTLCGGLTVSAVALSAGGTKATLTHAGGMQTPSAVYSLTVKDINDLATPANVIAPNPTVVNFTATPINLVTNGDFLADAALFTQFPGYATGVGNPASITNWTYIPGPDQGEYHKEGVNGTAVSFAGVGPFGPANAGGNTYAFLQRGGELVQALTLTPGTTYRLSFDTAGRVGYNNSVIRVKIDDNSQVYVSSGDLVGYPAAFSHYTYTFTTPATFDGIPSIHLENGTPPPDDSAANFANVSVSPDTGVLWDVINENYGSACGEVSFNANYSFLFGSVAPPETLSAGKATLSIPQGGGVVYPYKAPTVPNWSSDANVTIEWKIAFRQGGSAVVFFSQNQVTASSTWGGIEMFDQVYGPTGYTPNAIADYFRRVNDQNLAPVGFNSSVPHTYRFVRQGGTNSLYLDNNPIPLISPLVNQPNGASGDGLRWGWGFYRNAASVSEVDVYSFKAAHGAFPPPSGAGPLLGFASTGNQLTLSWSACGFVLQCNTNLVVPNGWVNLTNTSPAIVPMDAPDRFYRLAKP